MLFTAILTLIFLLTPVSVSAYEYDFQKSPGITVDVLSELEFEAEFGDNSDIPRTDAEVIALAEGLFPVTAEL